MAGSVRIIVGSGEECNQTIPFILLVSHFAKVYSPRIRKVELKYTDKTENQIFLIYKEIQNGTVANSYMRKGFLNI
jgi:hypothetical protein